MVPVGIRSQGPKVIVQLADVVPQLPYAKLHPQPIRQPRPPRGRGRLARGQPDRQQGQHANGAKTHA